jgi:hypothetical protein
MKLTKLFSTLAWILLAIRGFGTDPSAEPHTYCVIGSLSSPNVRPTVIRVLDIDNRDHSFDRRVRSLRDGWDLLLLLKMNVVLSPELGAKLSKPANRLKLDQLWDQINNQPLTLHMREILDSAETLKLLRDVVGGFRAGSGCQVHFEPQCLASLAYHAGYHPDETVTLMLVEGEQERVKEAEFAVTSRLAVTWFGNGPGVPEPRDTTEAWRHIVEGEFGGDGVKVMEYDGDLNVLIIRANDQWVKDFLMLWVQVGVR